MKPDAEDHLQCPEARAAIQARLDEPLPADRQSALFSHLRECEACSAYQAELGTMRDALRSMPPFRLPAELREDVRSATGSHDSRVAWFFQGFVGRRRRAAVAAVLALAVGATWWTLRSPGPQYSDAEVARAAEDLELALGLAGGALTEVQRITRQDVLAESVLVAMRHISLPWPSTAETPFREGGSSDDQEVESPQ